MRLVSVDIAGFRGFPQRRTIDLDADVIIVSAPNGQGKTSLFDAIMWALTGAVPRIGPDSELVSLFSDTATASVSLRLREDGGRELNVTRSIENGSSGIALSRDGAAVLRGPSAEAALLQALWPEGSAEPEPLPRLRHVFTRSLYLQQDVVRAFVDEDDPGARFQLIETLVGVGQVVELQRQLETSQRGWNTATTHAEQSSARTRSLLDAARAELSVLSPETTAAAEVDLQWNSWIRSATELGLSTSELGADRAKALNSVINEADARMRPLVRRAAEMQTILSDLRTRPTDVAPLDAERLRVSAEEVNGRILAVQAELTRSREQLAEERRRLTELAESIERHKALAALALQDLTEICPVCNQPHVVADTRARLERIVASGVSPDTTIDEQQIPALTLELRNLEIEQGRIATLSAAATEAERTARVREATVNRQLQALGLPESATPEIVATELANIERAAERLSALRASGEALALLLSRASEFSLRTEREETIRRLDAQLAAELYQLTGRRRTADLSRTIIEDLQNATEALVDLALKDIEPLLGRIYGRMDPHPVFRRARFDTRMFRRRGQLSAVLDDPLTPLSTQTPEKFLSSSQVNALAVAIFLAFNLGMPTLRLEAALLDDPLQSLDDVNLLGLIDLLRRARDQRQLVVSTHDARFAQLLARKLRPVRDNQRTVWIELEGWGRQGPEIKATAVSTDMSPIRMVV
ncbi:MAG: hypothetical protein C4558_05165 [Dehalococcoidia bacterium]|nr:MAG: hypothetical protein C4558_05165 [Dehalococcoidia bacterium]